MKEFMSKTLVIGTIAVVLLVFALVGLFLWQMQPSSVPSPTPESQTKALDTSDWQTYRNDEFGFEMKYPKDWFNTTDKERNTIYDEQGNPIELKHYEFSNKKESLYGEYDANVAVFKINISEDIKFFERIQKLKVNEKSGKLPGIVYTKLGDFTINGYPAVRYIGDYSAIPAGVLPRGEEVLLRKGNNVFHLMLIGKFGGTVEGYKNIFNQILSTFRFVE